MNSMISSVISYLQVAKSDVAYASALVSANYKSQKAEAKVKEISQKKEEISSIIGILYTALGASKKRLEKFYGYINDVNSQISSLLSEFL